jgi:chromosome segregation and condensation protein ScpB
VRASATRALTFVTTETFLATLDLQNLQDLQELELELRNLGQSGLLGLFPAECRLAHYHERF